LQICKWVSIRSGIFDIYYDIIKCFSYLATIESLCEINDGLQYLVSIPWKTLTYNIFFEREMGCCVSQIER
jgi:hypothetical protein